MKKVFVFLLFIFFILGVFGQQLQEEDNNRILEELRAGQISAESISVISDSKWVSIEQQTEFVSVISGLSQEKQDSFWDSFWKLSAEERSGFIKSFSGEKKNEFLNVFSNQYIKSDKRESPVMKFNLKGDVDVGLEKTKGGQEFLRLGEKKIPLDDYKGMTSERSSFAFDYDLESDTLIQTQTRIRNGKTEESKFVVKGGRFVMGRNTFSLLKSDGTVDKTHALTGMKRRGNVELDLTGEEYKMLFDDKGMRPSFVDLENGMNFGPIKDSEKKSEVVFGKDGQVKSVEDLEMEINSDVGFTAVNGKYRVVSDVLDLKAEGGKLDKEKMDKLLLEGRKESDYVGYIAYDPKGGEDGKPFVAAVAESGGFSKIGEERLESLKKQGIVSVGDMMTEIEAFEKSVQIKDDDGWIAKAAKGSKLMTSISDLVQSDDLSFIDKVLVTNDVRKTLDYFAGKIAVDPTYLDPLGENPSRESIEKYYMNRRNDANQLMGMIGRIDSIYDSVIPKVEVFLTPGLDVGTLAVGGNVEVHNGDLLISENIKGVSFGAGVVADGGDFKIDSSIDKIFTSNSDNVWEIKKNSQGQLEPFMVGVTEPSVEITRLDMKSKIEGDKVSTAAWWHDVFSWEENEIEGRVLEPASVSLRVTEEEKRRLDAAQSAVVANSVEGAYDLSVTLSSSPDMSGKSVAASVNENAQREIAKSIGTGRNGINEIIGILETDTSEDSFAIEKAFVAYLEKNKGSGSVVTPFVSEMMLDLAKQTPSIEVVQMGVDFATEGYSSYESFREVNAVKISNALRFIDGSLGYVQGQFATGNVGNDMVAVSLVKKENGDLFLRNSQGTVMSIDSEIEPIIGRLIPALVNEGVRSTQKNQVLDAKNYKFIEKVEYFTD